jgi:uncharacterized membrane protein
MSMSYLESRPAPRRVSTKAIRDMEETHHAGSRINVGEVERWASAIGGGLLVLHGLRRGTFGGLALAMLGGALVYRGVSGHCQAYCALNLDTSGKHRADAEEHVHKGVLVKHTATINRTPMEVYDFVKDPANHHRYMEHVESVRADEDGTFHWAIEGPFGSTWRFRSRHINEEPGHLVAWKTLPGGDIDSAGAIRLVPAWDGRGTDVTMEINFEPPAGAVGMAIAKILGHDPDAQVRENLRRLKNLLEAGEIPTIEGQPSGRAASRA